MSRNTAKQLAIQLVKRRNRDDATDMGKVEMRPRDPYEILGLKKEKEDGSKLPD
jgi:hypothetical protein